MKDYEKKHLIALLDSVKNYSNYTDGFFIIVEKIEESHPLKDTIFYNDIDSWINNINYLNNQVIYYGKEAIKSLENLVEENFNISGERYKEIYKETENIMFRISILWDVLAQIFNRIFNLDENIDEIHHLKFFNQYQKNGHMDKGYYSLAKEIFDYFEEEDNTDGEEWSGNFTYCKTLRNSFTHSLNPHIWNFNNGSFNNQNRSGMNLSVHPLFELTRLIQDFVKLNYFIWKLLSEHVPKNKLHIRLEDAEE